jgi:hypothetical protein
MLGDPGLKTLRLSPWRLNLHTKWGREGNGMWGRGPAQRKQIYKKKFPRSNAFYLPSLHVEEGGRGSAPCGLTWQLSSGSREAVPVRSRRSNGCTAPPRRWIEVQLPPDVLNPTAHRPLGKTTKKFIKGLFAPNFTVSTAFLFFLHRGCFVRKPVCRSGFVRFWASWIRIH